jgi:hypothetical protein
LNRRKLPWKDHPERRAARVTEILKGQLPRTAQNLRKGRKSRKVMVNTTAVNMGITLHTLQKKSKKKPTINTLDVIAEEMDYQKKLKWLKDHGELTGEEGNNPGEDSSGNDSA